MSEGSSKIRYIVRVCQMLRRWREKAAAAGRLITDVPAGHIAVTVGTSSKRYVIPTTHLTHPLFQKLLLQSEEEYGFTNSGPLAIPCAEEVFEEILLYLTRTESRNMNTDEFRICCHMGFRSNLVDDFFNDSQPFLHSVAKNPVC